MAEGSKGVWTKIAKWPKTVRRVWQMFEMRAPTVTGGLDLASLGISGVAAAGRRTKKKWPWPKRFERIQKGSGRI